jgi:hypothetical protein
MGFLRSYSSGRLFASFCEVYQSMMKSASVFNCGYCKAVSVVEPELVNFFLQRQPEKPCLNNVTEIGTVRKVGLSIVLLLALATLLPFWDGLGEELGIGLSAPPF